LVEDSQTAAALFAWDGYQNFMPCFGDVDGHSNWGILCNNNLGHSRSALRCGLLQKPL
jgi:hypothetical protein